MVLCCLFSHSTRKDYNVHIEVPFLLDMTHTYNSFDNGFEICSVINNHSLIGEARVESTKNF